ncbi:ankyrin repeat domain-containing protein [Acaryochloris marina]|uniref:ankyrin repeat domain-containing protein n=1 Tax=Acaryochloris marina TaxID=155978 RepID=UPI001BAF6CA3|nr:ankyrin repeat domain-containing protein [Acaryochloris marina]QUY43241.1 ankyrin repeat domain-containing protein [Acaryochloris marina S15]
MSKTEVSWQTLALNINFNRDGQIGEQLYQAIHKDQAHHFHTLLHKNKIDVATYGPSFLTEAISAGSLQIIQLLIHLELSINWKYDLQEEYPLTQACRIGRLDIIKFLMQAGANINLRGYNSPLWTAIQSDSLHIAEFLINSGADINIEIDDFYNVLGIAADKGHFAGVKILTESAIHQSLNPELLNIELALQHAAMSGEAEIFDYLVDFCTHHIELFDHSAIDDLRDTLQTGIIRKSRREDPCISACTRAVGENDITRLQELIASGVDMNLYTDKGYTLLHAAIDQELIGVVHVLLDAGIDYELRDEYCFQETPLLMASSGNFPHHPAIVEALLHAGADVKATHKGMTPLMIAINTYFRQIIDIPQFLVRPSREERRRNAIQVIRLLLQFGSEVNSQNLQGRTPLMLAAQTDDSVLMQLLLFAGADPNLQDAAGKTYVDYVP